MGATIVTFFAAAMQGVIEERSLIILIGAFFGLLPDTLDFKFMQYIETHHVVIDPHPDDPNPQGIASTLADAINRAAALKPGKMLKVQLHTMKLGPDLWREYAVFFDTQKQEVRVRIGPECTTGRAMIPKTEPPEEKAIGVASFTPKVIDPYGRPSEIASFSGPSFGFLKRKDGIVEVVFLPWHRRSGHSLTLGALFALIGYFFFDWLGSPIPHIYAAAIFFPWTAHLILDQYGHMGNNLFWPLTRQRNTGLGLVSAADPFWNFFTIYSCVAIIFWNMNRYAHQFAADPTRVTAFGLEIPLWYYLLLVIVIPISILAALIVMYKALRKERPEEVEMPVRTAAAAIAMDLGADQRLEIRERPVPHLMWRILGLVILFVMLAGLYYWGGTL